MYNNKCFYFIKIDIKDVVALTNETADKDFYFTIYWYQCANSSARGLLQSKNRIFIIYFILRFNTNGIIQVNIPWHSTNPYGVE